MDIYVGILPKFTCLVCWPWHWLRCSHNPTTQLTLGSFWEPGMHWLFWWCSYNIKIVRVKIWNKNPFSTSRRRFITLGILIPIWSLIATTISPLAQWTGAKLPSHTLPSPLKRVQEYTEYGETFGVFSSRRRMPSWLVRKPRFPLKVWCWHNPDADAYHTNNKLFSGRVLPHLLSLAGSQFHLIISYYRQH